MSYDTDVDMGDDENEEAEIENVLTTAPVTKRKAGESPSNRAHKLPRHHLHSHPVHGPASAPQPVVGASTSSGEGVGASHTHPSSSISVNRPSSSTQPRQPSATQTAGASSSSHLLHPRPVGTRPRSRSTSGSSSSLDLRTTLTQTATRLDVKDREKEKEKWKIVPPAVVARKRVINRPRVSNATLLHQVQNSTESSTRTRIRPKMPVRMNLDSLTSRPRPLDTARKRRASGAGGGGNASVLELTNSDSTRRRVSSVAANKDDPIVISSGSEDAPVSTQRITTPSTRPRPSVSSQQSALAPSPRKRYRVPNSSSKSKQPPPQDAEIILISDSDDVAAPPSAPIQLPTSSVPLRTLDAAASPPRCPEQPAQPAPIEEQPLELPLEDHSIPEPEGFDAGELDFAPLEVGMEVNLDRPSPPLTSNILSPRPPPFLTTAIPPTEQQATNPMDEEEENMFESYINIDQGADEGIFTDRQDEVNHTNEGPLSALGDQRSMSSTPEEGQITPSAPQEGQIITSTPEEGEIVSTDDGIGVASRTMSVPGDGQVAPISEREVCPDRGDVDVEMGNGQGEFGDKQVEFDPNDMPSTPESGEIYVGNKTNDKPKVASLPSPPPIASNAPLGTALILPERSAPTPAEPQCDQPALSTSASKPASISPSRTDHPPSPSPAHCSSPPIIPALSRSSILAIPDIATLNVRFKRPSTENGENAFFSRALVARKSSGSTFGVGTPISSEKTTLVENDVGKSQGDDVVPSSVGDGKSTVLELDSGVGPPASAISREKTGENIHADIEMHSPLKEAQDLHSELPVLPAIPPSNLEPPKDVPTQGTTQSQAATSVVATPPVPATKVSSRPSIAPSRIPPPLVSPKMTLADAINFVRREHLARSSSDGYERGKEKKKAAKPIGADRSNLAESTRQSTPSDVPPKSRSVRNKTPSLDNLRSLLVKHNVQPRSNASDSQSTRSASRSSTTVSRHVVKSPTTQRRGPPERNTATFDSFISPVRSRANEKRVEGDSVVSASSSGKESRTSQSQNLRSPQNRRKSAVASFETFIVKVPPASPVIPAESRSTKRRTVAPPLRSNSDDSDKLLELASVHLGSEKPSDGIPDRHLPLEVSSASGVKSGHIENPPAHVQVEQSGVSMEVDGTSQETPPIVPQNEKKDGGCENTEVVSESEMSWDANPDQPEANLSLPGHQRQPSENLIIPDDSSASRGVPEELVAMDMDSIQKVPSGRSSARGHCWRQTTDSEVDSNEQELVTIPVSSIAAGSDEAKIDYNIIAPAASRTASSGSHSTGSFSGAISPDPLDVAGTKNRPAFDFGAQEFIGGYPVVTWRSHAAAQRQLPPKYHLAKDLPHSLPDRMNALPIEYRNSDFARVVLEAVIQEAMDNEPDAPPIEIYQNNIGEETTPPWEFVYTNHMWFGEGVPPPDIKNLKSCGCIGRCDPKSKTCACAKRQYEWAKPYIADGTFPSSWQGSPFVYDNKGLLQMFGCPIFECNQFCGCDDDCPNRVIQNGRKWPVNIVRTERKGWGVFAGAKKIPKGAYIGIYAGELLTDPEGEERGKHYNAFGRTYLFTIDFHYLTLDMENPDLYENLYVVDAYHAGNFTRFVNHSCDPNCQIFASYINEADINKPLLTFFTIRDVDPWEELCFSYWGDIESKREDIEVAKARGEESATDAVYAICQCGSSNCIGRMF